MGAGIMVGKWRNRNLRHLRRLLWRNAAAVRQRRQRRHSRRCGIAGELEHVAHRSALHASIRPPRSLGILIAAPPAIVERIGIDDHSRRAMFLRDEFLHPAEVLAVANQDDLAAHIDLQLLQLLEIFRRAVVGIDHFRLGISRRRHAVERHHDAGIVVVRIAIDVLARGTVHFDSGRRGDVHADFRWIVDPHLVFDDLGVEPGGAKLLRPRNPLWPCLPECRPCAEPASACADALPRAWDRARRGNGLRQRFQRRHRESRRWVESQRKTAGP